MMGKDYFEDWKLMVEEVAALKAEVARLTISLADYNFNMNATTEAVEQAEADKTEWVQKTVYEALRADKAEAEVKTEQRLRKDGAEAVVNLTKDNAKLREALLHRCKDACTETVFYCHNHCPVFKALKEKQTS